MVRRNVLLFLFMVISIHTANVITERQLEPHMFSQSITGEVTPLQPTTYGTSQYWPFPVEVYEIAMMRAKHQFLPSKFNATEIFAYAGKVNGKFVPSFPGPTLSVLKNMPIYVIYTNNIQGRHILPVDTSPPFDMVAQFQNEVPVVPHAHGLETEMGPDGQPMGFWTKSGRKGPDFFTLKSASRKPNQAIFRYHNTKEGLFWYHDHAMAITRLNVYAGLVGLYEIIDPQISTEESNILRIYGDIERKYFAIVDKTFKKDGQLFYPDKSDSSDFQSWVPEFFGNTFTVNGKVWPKVALKPKIYRLVLLNGCQSRFLNIYFENEGNKLDFEIFRRDSDFLQRPVKVKEHLLLLGGRIEIFLDLRNVRGEVMLRNDAKTPYPMGEDPNEFMQQIMKIVVNGPSRNLQTDTFSLIRGLSKITIPPASIQPSSNNNQIPLPLNLQPSLSQPIQIPSITQLLKPVSAGLSNTNTFLTNLKSKMDLYTSNQKNLQSLTTLDFLDEAQSLNYNAPPQSTQKQISLADFINSNDQNALNPLIDATSNQIIQQASIRPISTNLDSIALVNQNINNQKISLVDFITKSRQTSQNITNVPYPRFGAGKPYFTILTDVQNSKGDLSGVMIDGVPVRQGCKGSFFKQGEVYDFFIINFTMDDHPIHIHLVNFQVIRRFKFDLARYKKDWEDKNGKLQAGGVAGIPKQLDVRPYKLDNSEEPPKEEEKQFLDVILVPSEKVTVARVKFSNHYGKSFPFDVSGARYVWHCHILEHEDNEMMRYFCVQ